MTNEVIFPNNFGANNLALHNQELKIITEVVCNEEKKYCEVIKNLTNIHSENTSSYSLSFCLNNFKDHSISYISTFFSQPHEYLIINSHIEGLNKPPPIS